MRPSFSRLLPANGLRFRKCHSGLTPLDPGGDTALVDELLEGLRVAEADMTLFFRKLSDTAPGLLAGGELDEPYLKALIHEISYSPEEFAQHGRLVRWMRGYLGRLKQEPAGADAIREGMHRANPKYVLRNYLAQETIESAEVGDLLRLETLLKVLERPYDEQPGREEFARKRPEWARTRPGCATLSCSS